jgi:phage-related protein
MVFNGIIQIVGFVIAGVIQYFADLLLAFSSVISSGSFVARAITAVWTYIGEVIRSAVVFVIEALALWVGTFAGVLEAIGAFGQGATQGFNKLGEVIADFARGALRIIGKLLTGIFSAARRMVTSIVDAIRGVFTGGNNSAEEAARSIGGWTTTVFRFADAGARALRGVQSGLQNTANSISRINVGNFVESFVDGLARGSATAGNLLNGIAQRVRDFANRDWGTGVADAAVRAATIAAEWLRSAATSVLDFTQEGFTQNLTEGISGFLDLVE